MQSLNAEYRRFALLVNRPNATSSPPWITLNFKGLGHSHSFLMNWSGLPDARFPTIPL